MKVGVIVINWNSKELTEACLRGLQYHENCPIYVVDNGSNDGSPEYIERTFPSIQLIRSPINLGFSSGNNLGIRRALADGCDAVFLLNNDTIIDEPFLHSCVKVMIDKPSIGIVGPVVVEGKNPFVIQTRGGNISLWKLDFPYIGAGEEYIRSEKIDYVDYVLGAAMLVRRIVLERTDGFDPEYYPAYVEEADLCYRAQQFGFKCVIVHSARIRHIGQQSSEGYENIFRRITSNRFLFGIKHLDFIRFIIAGQIIIWRVFINKLAKALNL